MADEIIIETTSTEVIEVSSPGPQGPAGAAGTGLETLTTQGDTLYRGETTGERLPIGTTGQVLKVSAQGIPAWANESGAVTSVNGRSGAVVLDGSDIDTSGNDDLAAFVAYEFADGNGIYYPLPDTTIGNKRVYRTTTGHHVFFQSLRWHITDGAPITANIIESSDDDNAAWPWLSAWDGSIEKAQLSTVVGRARSTFLFVGDSIPNSSVSGLATVAASGDYDDLSGKPSTFAPSSHSSSHASAGSDPLAPSDIGAQSIFVTEALGTVAADVTLTAARAKIYTLNTTTSGLRILLPTTNVQTGDVVQIRFASQNGSTIAPVRGTLTGFFGNSIRSGQQVTFIAESTSGTSWEEAATNRTPPETITLTAGDVVVGKATSGAGTATQVSIGTEENSVARGNHVHGNITNDGKIGSTAGLPIVTTTAGAVTTLALGTANQVLRVNSGATGVEFADPAASGVTGAASSASDVLGVSGANITGVDANADRIVFWDDSASALKYLEAGSGLSISGTTLTATASGGSKTYAVFTAEHNQPPSTAFATLDTRNSIAVLDFDDATDESAVFVSIMPEGASLGSGLKIRLHWMATTATSGNVVWDVSLERMTTDLDSDSFDTIASGTAAANGTSGILTVTEITLTTIDSVTAGDGYRLKVTRDANNGSDSMSGDAELVLAEVRSAA